MHYLADGICLAHRGSDCDRSSSVRLSCARNIIADFWFPTVVSFLVLPVAVCDSIRFARRIPGGRLIVSRRIPCDRPQVGSISPLVGLCCRSPTFASHLVPEFYFPESPANDVQTNLSKVKTFLISEDGPTAVEYAVMLAMIVGAMIAAIVYVGRESNEISEKDVVRGARWGFE